MKRLLLTLLLTAWAGAGWGATWRVIEDSGNYYWKSYASPTDTDWPTTGVYDGTATTLNTLEAAIATGDTVEFSGSTAGATYVDTTVVVDGPENTVWKAYTGTNASHNGTVTMNAHFRLYETVEFHNFLFDGVANANWLSVSTNGYIKCYDCIFVGGGGASATWGFYSLVSTGYTVGFEFYRCTFEDFNSGAYTASRLLYTQGTQATVVFNFCEFKSWGNTYMALNGLAAGSTVTAINNTIYGAYSADSRSKEAWMYLPNNGNATVTMTNNLFLHGSPPIEAGASTTGVTATYNAYEDSRTGTTTFDTSGTVSCGTGCLSNSADGYTSYNDIQGTGGHFGNFIIRIDDLNNLDDAVVVAGVMNPEIKIMLAAEAHTAAPTSAAFTLDQLGKLRTFVNDGNELAPHGRTHADFSDMTDVFDIACSAGCVSPTYDVIVTDRNTANDSTTWDVDLQICNNSVCDTIDLVAGNSGDLHSITTLETAVEALTTGGGTFTATDASDNHQGLVPMLMAADPGSPAALPASVDFDATAFAHIEGKEAIADLQAYVRTGCDRNAAHCVASAEDCTDSEASCYGTAAQTYTVTSFISPYGLGSAELEAVVIADANIVGGSIGYGTGNQGATFLQDDTDNSFYAWVYDQNPSDAEMRAAISYTAAGGFIYMPLWHPVGSAHQDDTWPNYGSTDEAGCEALKALLVRYGVGTETFTATINRIRADAGFVISEPNYHIDSSLAGNYMGNFAATPVAGSSLINAGFDVCSTLGGDQYDLAGVQVCDTGAVTGPWTNGVEIGAYGFTATGGGGIIGGGLIPGMFGMSGGGGGGGAPAAADALLLEIGDYVLLETGDNILIE